MSTLRAGMSTLRLHKSVTSSPVGGCSDSHRENDAHIHEALARPDEAPRRRRPPARLRPHLAPRLRPLRLARVLGRAEAVERARPGGPRRARRPGEPEPPAQSAARAGEVRRGWGGAHRGQARVGARDQGGRRRGAAPGVGRARARAGAAVAAQRGRARPAARALPHRARLHVGAQPLRRDDGAGRPARARAVPGDDLRPRRAPPRPRPAAGR